MFAYSENTFVWKRPRGQIGYVWEPLPGRSELQLMPAPGAEFVYYHPLKTTAKETWSLYRELASIDVTPEGALSFANRFGQLEGRAMRPIGGSLQQFETFLGWVHVVGRLRETVRIWDLYQAKNVTALAKDIRWTGSRVDYVFSQELKETWTITGTGKRARPLMDEVDDDDKRYSWGYDLLRTEAEGQPVAAVQSGEVLVPALLFVVRAINEGIQRNNGPLLWWDDRRGKIVYQDLPFNLYGAVWFQFAQAVHLGRQARRCRVCGTWFEVAAEAGRTDRVICSDACRTRSYKERRERAAQLHRDGMPVKQIASEVGSDLKTVRGWITDKKKGN
jgi:hypothetical protein